MWFQNHKLKPVDEICHLSHLSLIHSPASLLTLPPFDHFNLSLDPWATLILNVNKFCCELFALALDCMWQN